MDETRICSHCGCVLEEDEGTELDDDLLCDDCMDEHTVTCDHCGETVWREDAEDDGRTVVCSCCFDNHYRRCESCGRIIHDDDACWRNDYAYCSGCYDELESEIEDYSFKPEPIFYGSGSRYFGVELEIDAGGKDEDNACRIKQTANNNCEHIYCKSDGSLDDGFEIVTHPMSLQYHMDNMPWAEVMQEAISQGYRSHMTSTCGLHVHVNRDAFGETRDEQEAVIERLLFFVELHWCELFTFSRRSQHNMDRWAARYGMEKTGKLIMDKAKKCSTGRYAAVNLCPYHTIEFRLFRGTLKLNTLLATLQLVNRICDVALSMTEAEIENQSWRDFVMTVKEPELVQYLRERQLYVNDKIETEAEM